MSSKYVSANVALMSAALLLAGCPAAGPSGGQDSGGGNSGSANNNNGGGAAQPPVDEGPKSYKISELGVGLGDYLPPLDGGRVEIAIPDGWRAGSRQEGYVVWFHEFKDARLLPNIRVTAEDAPADAPQDATKENAQEYAKWVEANVKTDLGEKEKLIEEVVPLVLEGNAFGRYVRAGKKGETLVERQILTTTHNGRVYHIELIVFPEKLPASRDAGYLVGASMKFLDDGSGNLTPGGEDETP